MSLSESERRHVPFAFPGKEVFIQRMAFSTRFPDGVLEFAIYG